VKRLAASTAAALVALPAANAVSEVTDPPPVPETVKKVTHEHDAELAREKKAKRRAERKARFRLRQVRNLRVALRWHPGGVIGGLLCIHRYEGSWRDPNDPYWGGLQMDRGFQSTYAPAMVRRYGTANRWPVDAQLAAGVLAYYDARGFGPWPNTSRMCGL
jgi:hypothetical protein